MTQSVKNEVSLEMVKDALSSRMFGAYVARDSSEAERILYEKIIPESGAESVAWGGSLTVEPFLPGIRESFKNKKLIDTQESGVPWLEIYERRRQALLVDLFLTGTNAITADGEIVNLDAIGNRAGALSFGPKHVVVIAGKNKIVADRAAAIDRIKNHVAPLNAKRLGFNTPCVKTGRCVDCRNQSRICSLWTIQEWSIPDKRISVILINEDKGL